MEELFPKLSKATYNARVYYLGRLGVTDPKYYSTLKDIESTLRVINKGSVSTRKTSIMHVLSFLKAIGDDKLMNKYHSLVKEDIIKSAQDKEIDGVTNKSSTYKSLEDIQKELLANKPKILTLVKFNAYTNKVYYLNNLQDYILASIYILNPAIRNNYHDVKIINNLRQRDPNINQILINSKDVKFYLNKFKNVGSMGEQVIKYNNDTTKIIRSFYTLMKSQFTDMEYFINSITRNGIKVLPDSALSARIKKINHHYFGEDWSINDIRHIWENAIQNDPNYMQHTISEREGMHRQLLHSARQAMAYKTFDGKKI